MASALPRVLLALGIGAALIAAGTSGALLTRHATQKVAGDLPAGTIHETLASAESMRTLGEALRTQTHEHGNRMHTAIALLELSCAAEAIGLLTDSSRQNQVMVDQVSARTGGDPTAGAMLLGKASQAAERGIEWIAEIAPDAPGSILDQTDAVAVLGNLADNALDTAASVEPPRWVRVTLARAFQGQLRVAVGDSGAGVPAELRNRIFERGFSTKPAGREGRGIGLALVREVVARAGGPVTLADPAQTEFRVTLPAVTS